MDEVWKWFLAWWPSIAGAATGLVVSIFAYVRYRISLKKEKAKTEALSKALDDARRRNTYSKCPHCGRDIPLSKLHFYLADDIPDDNLNGLPDDQEN